MSNYDWDSIFESGEFKHWEPVLSSPELATIVAAELLEINASVLDIGCGGGVDTIFLAQYSYRVIGMDFSNKALKIAKSRANKLRVKIDWCQGSVFNLPIKSETIDFVNDRGVFHVIEDSDRSKYVSELHRVLKIQGFSLIRGASKEVSQDRFNPISTKAIDRFFPKTKFSRGPVVPIPLFSSAGSMDSRMVMLRKIANK